MANSGSNYTSLTASNSSALQNSGSAGVCMINKTWRDEQHPSFINFISSFLSLNSFRLNFVPLAPDIIFNCAGLSIAFIFLTNWDCCDVASIFCRIEKLKQQFAHFYIVVTLSTREQNDAFVHSYFKHGMELGKPPFVLVHGVEMGFEKIVQIAHSRGGKILLAEAHLNYSYEVINRSVMQAAACKKHDAVSKLKAERKQAVEGMDIFYRVVTSIPGIDNHDANSLNQGIGSIEGIAKASKEHILGNTDLSAEKAEMVTRFFRDPKLYLSTKIS